MTRHIAIGVQANAEFDAAMRNRFLLTRVWSKTLPLCGFCLTNPSKAGKDIDDPTAAKCQTYARRWGYGGIQMCNAFSWCATDPKELHTRVEGQYALEFNLATARQVAEDCEILVCGWGRNGLISGRAARILQELLPWASKLRALRLLSDGTPEHPLYLPTKLTPIPLPVVDAEVKAGRIGPWERGE